MLTKDGDIYAVGEMNFHQLGIPNEQLPKSTVFEQDGVTPSYVPVPTKLTTGPGGTKLPKFKQISTGVDHSLALLAEDGSAWTWGFGAVYQLGHGKPEGEDDPEDEPVPTKIENTASRGVNMVFCGAGGQFSILAGVPRQQDGI
jgi:regulator of chromosome condensation